MPEQIWTPGPQAAPLKYTVPGTGEIVPLACQALYDGSGAAGAYVPALIFRSQAGHVISRAIVEATVAGGDDAEVSWFPGVKAGSGSGATVAWAYLDGSGLSPTVITGDPVTGNPTFLPWQPASFTEDGSGVFFFDPLAPTYIQCSVSPQPGYFVAYTSFQHDNNSPTAVTFADIRTGLPSEAPVPGGPRLLSAGGVQSSDDGDPTVPGAKFAWGVTAWYASRGDTTPIGFRVEVLNFNAALADLNAVSTTFAVALVAA